MTTTLTRRLFGASIAALSFAAAPAMAAPKAKGDKPLYKDASQSIDARVQDLLGRMTLEEKAAQLIGIWLTKNKIQTRPRTSPTAWARSRVRPTARAPSPPR
jgi:beta-glucosidase